MKFPGAYAMGYGETKPADVTTRFSTVFFLNFATFFANKKR